jgi:hypothetical protein
MINTPIRQFAGSDGAVADRPVEVRGRKRSGYNTLKLDSNLPHLFLLAGFNSGQSTFPGHQRYSNHYSHLQEIPEESTPDGWEGRLNRGAIIPAMIKMAIKQ